MGKPRSTLWWYLCRSHARFLVKSPPFPFFFTNHDTTQEKMDGYKKFQDDGTKNGRTVTTQHTLVQHNIVYLSKVHKKFTTYKTIGSTDVALCTKLFLTSPSHSR